MRPIMKSLNKSSRKLQEDNRGFSLVELIIVIAIMAVLVGTVGAQVIPYLNNAKKARDIQILSAYATAAVVAYSEKVESVPNVDSMWITVVPGASGDVFTCADAQAVADEVKVLIDKDYLSDSGKPFKSKTYQNIDEIRIEFDFVNAKVHVYGDEGGTDKTTEAQDDIGAIL